MPWTNSPSSISPSRHSADAALLILFGRLELLATRRLSHLSQIECDENKQCDRPRKGGRIAFNLLGGGREKFHGTARAFNRRDSGF
jgi:hypothetical protein